MRTTRSCVCCFNPRRIFTRVSAISRLYSTRLVLNEICWRGADALESRQSSSLHPARTRHNFFCSIAGYRSLRLLMRCLKPLTAAWGARFFCARHGRPSAVAGESLRNVRPGGDCVSARRDLCARRNQRPPPASTLSRGARRTARRSFKVNSSNRFSALAEAALQSAGHSLPEQHEARFLTRTAEQSFVLSTRPAVVFPEQFISSPTRARSAWFGVAHDARYLHACARQ